MRTFIITFLLSTLLLIGCESSSDFSTDPLNLSKETYDQGTISDNSEYILIPLPLRSPLWQDSVLTMSQVIDGTIGGRMIMNKYYISSDGDSICIEADLRIPAGAFPGIETITMTVDSYYAAIHFQPQMVFEDTLRLFQSFKGMNLTNFNTGTIDFVFISNDGSIELVKKNGVQIVKPQGIVRVMNAKLPHFSRYGWVRKSFGALLRNHYVD